uniref:Envelope membrane protein n=1 Tax=Callipsygma wilsonis TaxID=2320807 RepID=A0A386AZY4_9CHLO|nr:Envelope membrane protein [Callipsygma wilsonis]AYC65001.1 Envelope membrane protein [Callipsygma wilsonis]
MIPRSILRIIQRFFKQICLKTDLFAIYEFRVSHYIVISAFQCLFFLIIFPWIFQFLIKLFLFIIIKYPKDIFLNFNQQEQAFLQIQIYSKELYFEKFIYPSYLKQNFLFEYAFIYNQQSFLIIINWVLDLITLIFFFFLLIFLTPQIIIFQTFFIETLLGLGEITKCFLLIFSLDLLVGFHSSKSWEVFLLFSFEHLGISKTINFIPLFISIFPVLLDTVFKYCIFRYLNKVSPSTVATYKAMIE